MNKEQNEQFRGLRPGSKGQKGKKGPPPNYKYGPFSWILIFSLILTATWWFGQLTDNNISWNDFVNYLKNGQIESVEVGETEIKGTFKEMPGSEGKKLPGGFTVDYKQDVVGKRLVELLEESGISWKFSKQHIWLLNLISLVLPIIVVVGIFYFIFARNLRGEPAEC